MYEQSTKEEKRREGKEVDTLLDNRMLLCVAYPIVKGACRVPPGQALLRVKKRTRRNKEGSRKDHVILLLPSISSISNTILA
jgi:hypothetical protein